MNKILIIKTKGLHVNIPGIASFRTPASIDITKVDVNLVNAELEKQGIREFKIIDKPTTFKEKIINKLEALKNFIDPNIQENNTESILKHIKDNQVPLDKVEGVLRQLLEEKNSQLAATNLEIIKKLEHSNKIESLLQAFIEGKNLESKTTEENKIKEKIAYETGLMRDYHA